MTEGERRATIATPIVLVIGAGHLPGIQEILEKELPKIEIPTETKMSFKLE